MTWRFRGVVVAVALLSSGSASAEAPNGPDLVRTLGSRAAAVLSSDRTTIGALLSLPPGIDERSLGLRAVAPGYALLRGSSAELLSFATNHPDVGFEVSPPLHILLDKAGVWTNAVRAHALPNADGAGVLVGVADTGLDVSHADLRDPVTGRTRVAWMLDLSLAPVGLYPDLEDKFGIKDGSGKVTAGAVLAGADIDRLLSASGSRLPMDEVGHGTHVTSIAAGNGGAAGQYVGFAPKATILFARITRDSSGSIGNVDLVSGTAFLFNRADALKMPVVVNLSVGTDFGPHDGTSQWEQALASFVGPAHPGHALVVAAGNSGSIVETQVHQNAHVSHAARTRVAITTVGAQMGQVQVWVAMRSGASLRVGLDGPDGEWVAPVSDSNQNAKKTNDYTAGVINGSSVPQSPIPSGSRGAIVVWSGSWPAGTYNVTLEGDGTADLFVEATGDAAGPSGQGAGFAYGVREGTVNLPATHPSLLAVGCTINRLTWMPIGGAARVGASAPLTDGPGGLPDPSAGTRPLVDGEVCWFSSAGPTVTGVAKPEISAPGGFVVAAMSKEALPGQPDSIFTDSHCPARAGTRCLQVDGTHAVAQGTSMSAPQVAGAVALLLQRDPSLTEDSIVGLLQAGAHPIRSGTPTFEDQAGPGELDVAGSLDALDQMRTPALHLPGACTADPCPNWMTLSADYASADGSTPLVAILELRTAEGARADLFDGQRLVPTAQIAGVPLSPPPQIVRKAPGVWFFSVTPPAGFGGSLLTLGATFDGVAIVREKTVPIATDTWTADYPSSAAGSCTIARSFAPSRAADRPWVPFAAVVLFAVFMIRKVAYAGRALRRVDGPPSATDRWPLPVDPTLRTLHRQACGVDPSNSTVARATSSVKAATATVPTPHGDRSPTAGTASSQAPIATQDARPAAIPRSPRDASRRLVDIQ